MGRVRELGSIEDVLEIARARRRGCGPVIDFAHMHATSDGAFTDVEAFAAVLEGADEVLEPGAPFHIHFSDIAYANRNETKHLPYGEGTLRAEPLRDALARFERPATVISESPDEASSQAIKAVLYAGVERRVAGDLGLVLLGLVDAATLAQEARERRQQLAPDQVQLLALDDRDRLAQQLLGLLVAALGGAHDPERHPRRRARDRVVRADRLARLERVPLGLVDLPAHDQHLREPALALAERAAVLQRLRMRIASRNWRSAAMRSPRRRSTQP